MEEARTIRTRSVRIDSSGGIVLEGQLDLPDEGAATPTAGVVICHPHPQYGGEMTNNVVMAVSSSIVAYGLAALRFNFRGAGRSGGAYDNGIGEQEDTLAALEALATGTVADELPNEMRVGLAGYSFGGGVALGAARGAVGLAALALISPAIGDDASQEALSALTMPKLIATGEADNFATVERVRGLAGMLPGSTEIYIATQTDHFWWGEEMNLGRRVGEFMASSVGRAQ
ncbi:MAG: alpha/beta hydrolase [Chloroflexi bacterium]|nr:alpha/beta hydrolase [Chloroflexota bacterium]